MLDVLDEKCDKVSKCIELGPAEEDCNANACEFCLAPNRIRYDSGPSQSFLSANPKYKRGYQCCGDSEKDNVCWMTDSGGAGGDHRENVRQEGDAGACYQDSDPVDVMQQALTSVFAIRRFRRGNGEESSDKNQGIDTTADVVAYAPANGVYQDAS